VFADDEDERTLVLTLTVEHGTFTIRLGKHAARTLARHLATAVMKGHRRYR
jgi:hypothetical protein